MREELQSNLVKFTPVVALVSAVLYLQVYWSSFDIVIFDFLPFSALVSYSIMPFFLAIAVLFTSLSLIFSATEFGTKTPKIDSALLVFLGIGIVVAVITAWVKGAGLYLLWWFLPFIGAPLAAYGLNRFKRGHSLFPDPKIRLAVYFSVCLVLLSAVALGKMQAGGVLSRADYYTIESKDARWIYLGKADNLLFLLSEKDSSTVITRVDLVTPFVLVHHEPDWVTRQRRLRWWQR
jgi:hypothetical protein